MFTLESLLSGLHIAQPILNGISLVVGLAALLYGYRLFRFFIFLAGFALGTCIAGFFTDTPTAFFIGLFAGAVCCVLWYLGVFVLGAALGAIVAVAIGFDNSVAVVSVAVIFGFLAIAIRKLMIVISTAYLGANLLVGGVSSVQFVISIFVAAVGVACQYTVTSGKSTPKDSKDASSPSNDREGERGSSASTDNLEQQNANTPKVEGIS